MKPDEVIHPLIYQSLNRYLSYHWGDALIQSLIRCRFNVKMSVRCLRTLREDKNCTASCFERCPFRNIVM